ncbi:MAG: helix-turn-helix transcriptional regulator, partial [Niameybacter sp.]|uniref:helix-turn-helix domain-containing protein n=1 Tax=Niameybacter sp. TaxID=2033640 RepID=UPI002FC6629F
MIDYERLFILLLKNKMAKIDLYRKVGINPKTINRLVNNQSVTVETLEKICLYFNCKIEDIIEIKK